MRRTASMPSPARSLTPYSRALTPSSASSSTPSSRASSQPFDSPVSARVMKAKGQRCGKRNFEKNVAPHITRACAEYIFFLVTVEPFDRNGECTAAAWSAAMAARPEETPPITLDENIIQTVSIYLYLLSFILTHNLYRFVVGAAPFVADALRRWRRSLHLPLAFARRRQRKKTWTTTRTCYAKVHTSTRYIS
jgi:hypothetical protein